MRLVNTWHGIWDHSYIQYLSRSFRFLGQRLYTRLQLFRTDFLWGLGRGTVMAMAKPLFCSRWTIFVMILRCASAHCPAGRSKPRPMIVHDTMYPNKMSRAFGRDTAPQHQRSATILHSGYEVLLCIAIFLSMPNPPLMFVAKKLYFGLIWQYKI